MTPREFARAMDEIAKGADYETVKAAGIKLVNEALGDFAELYLLGIEELVIRLQELKPARPMFGPPTTESIAAAQKESGEGRAAL